MSKGGFTPAGTIADGTWRDAFKRAGDLPGSLLERLGCPLVMAEPLAWGASHHRVLMLGQETAHWSIPEARTLRECLALDDPIAALARAYAAYDFGVAAPRVHFSRALRRLERELEGGVRGAVMWSNVMHIDCAPAGRASASIAALPRAEREAVYEWQEGVLAAEIEALRPNAVIAMCGPKYDEVLDREFPEMERQPVGNAPLRDVARLVHPALPRTSFRTHHPRTLEIAKSDALSAIIERVLDEVGDGANPDGERDVGGALRSAE